MTLHRASSLGSPRFSQPISGEQPAWATGRPRRSSRQRKQADSILQEGEQPSRLVTLPSSHSSVPCLRPSPHGVPPRTLTLPSPEVWHPLLQRLPGPLLVP